MNEYPESDLKRRSFLQILSAVGLTCASGAALSFPEANAQADDEDDLPAVPDAPSYIYEPDAPEQAARHGAGRAGQQPHGADNAAITVPANPNILVIMVDQLRVPLWLSSDQLNTLKGQNFCPTIYDRIYNHAVIFNQYYICSQVCGASRSVILTGLYTPQTGHYITAGATISGLDLDPNFPTYAAGLVAVNSLYAGNCWYIGKWHLSYATVTHPLPQPLSAYGFKTRTYPGPNQPSPNGYVNEGNNGGPYGCFGPFQFTDVASDSEIAGDFASWFGEHGNTTPWCVTVSFVNPHDISAYPIMKSITDTCPGGSSQVPIYLLQQSLPAGKSVYTMGRPVPWNPEDPTDTSLHKPSLQLDQFITLNMQDNPVSDFVDLLNYYYYMQILLDTQIKSVLDTIAPVANNTVVVFTSDHGEYGGSHGLHSKGGGVYDEVLRVPLWVLVPNNTTQTTRTQMCSAVDFFGFICDLGTQGSGSWRSAFPNLLTGRESIYSFLVNNAAESKRLITVNGQVTPYVLHTTDESYADFTNPALTFQSVQPVGTNARNHVVAIRTKTKASNAFTGAKYAIYSHWADCTVVPDGPDNSSSFDYEFYDYGNALMNRKEVGNNYYDTLDANSSQVLADLKSALGGYSPLSGLIKTALNATLQGNGTKGTPLSTSQATATEAYLNYTHGGTCPG